MWYLTAFLVGIAGSVHCIGMCGPIALALPGGQENHLGTYVNRAIYNLGRVLTYGLIGIVAGLIGKGLFLVGIQQWVSIFTGILLILSVWIPLSVTGQIRYPGFFRKFNSFLSGNLGNLLRKPGTKTHLFIGLLNGFLPCGLVYVALAGALNTGNIFNAVMYMVFFGLGTFPVMFAVSVFGRFISVTVRRKINRLIPVFIFILGILFILRGMNLGIKYISPVLKHKATTEQINVRD